MPTQQEIDDVLAKSATYQTKKGVSDAAAKVAELASNRANAARQAWNAVVDAGETDEEKLTRLLEAVVETGQDANAKQSDLQTKSTETSGAETQMSDAILALITPPPP